jgi:hypothetical protein
MGLDKAAILDEYARAAGYGTYENVPAAVKALQPSHVGSIFQPFPVRITSREFYTPYPELFEARWGTPLPAEALAEYRARREENNAEANRRATMLGMMGT